MNTIVYAQREEFNKRPGPGHWVAVFDKEQYAPVAVIFSCPCCKRHQGRPIDWNDPASRLDTPEHFKCVKCGMEAVLQYENAQWPYIGYSYSETVTNVNGSAYVTWTYKGPPQRWWRNPLTTRDPPPPTAPPDVGYRDDQDTDMIRKANAGAVQANWHDMGDPAAENAAQAAGALGALGS